MLTSLYKIVKIKEDIDIPLSKSEQSLSREGEEKKEMPVTQFESYSAHPTWYTQSAQNGYLICMLTIKDLLSSKRAQRVLSYHLIKVPWISWICIQQRDKKKCTVSY